MRFNLKERLGVLEAAIIFTKELHWIFRDQPLVDVGIDALIEESIEGNPTGKFLTAQIKGGKGNFYDKKESLIYYVSNIHQHYWLNMDLPIIIVAHIPEDNFTCWELISSETLVKTKSKWKIDIPKSKLLDKSAKQELQEIINSSIQSNFLQQFIQGEISDDEIEKIVKSTDKLSLLTATLSDLAGTMNNLNDETIKYTNKINYYVNKKLDYKNRQVIKVINDSSTMINSYSKKLHLIIENFSSEFAEAYGAFEKVAMMTFHLTQNYEELEKTYETIDELNKTIKSTTDKLLLMRKEVSGLPTDFDRLANARLRMIETCNVIINEFKISHKMSNHFAQWMYEKLY